MAAPLQVDFNADLGESFGWWEKGADDALLRVISSANVACGFHAGDPSIMRTTITRAKEHGVALGVHPGFPDLLGFGRRHMAVSPSDVRNYVLYQIGALAAFVRVAGLDLHHVKPHGALYMQALDDAATARAVAEAVAEYDDRLPLYTLAGSEMEAAAQRAGLRAVPEFFADRPVRQDGSVVMFDWWEVFDATPEVVSGRVASLMATGEVESLEGPPVPVTTATVCVHSDTPGAGELGLAVKAALDEAGVTISSEIADRTEGGMT
ncbi:MAG: LamB/YcsF family protein [Acidimicrobiales bacterium]